MSRIYYGFDIGRQEDFHFGKNDENLVTLMPSPEGLMVFIGTPHEGFEFIISERYKLVED